jgi:hypothetical protein
VAGSGLKENARPRPPYLASRIWHAAASNKVTTDRC